MNKDRTRNPKAMQKLHTVGYSKELGNFKTNPKVRDHCSFTGRYRGPAHRSCNLKLKIKPDTRKIPVVFHNLKGYDSHFIIQNLHTAKGNISCIAYNAEKYISFSLVNSSFSTAFSSWRHCWRSWSTRQTNLTSD